MKKKGKRKRPKTVLSLDQVVADTDDSRITSADCSAALAVT